MCCWRLPLLLLLVLLSSVLPPSDLFLSSFHFDLFLPVPPLSLFTTRGSQVAGQPGSQAASQEHLATIKLFITPLEIVLPWLLSRFTAGPRRGGTLRSVRGIPFGDGGGAWLHAHASRGTRWNACKARAWLILANKSQKRPRFTDSRLELRAKYI